MELFCAYTHNFAHMFVTYLSFSYIGEWDAETPPRARAPFRDEHYEKDGLQSESGDFFEVQMFGGICHPATAQSGRKWHNMVSYPANPSSSD